MRATPNKHLFGAVYGQLCESTKRDATYGDDVRTSKTAATSLGVEAMRYIALGSFAAEISRALLLATFDLMTLSVLRLTGIVSQ